MTSVWYFLCYEVMLDVIIVVWQDDNMLTLHDILVVCSCDPAGSYTMQCDEVTGDCQCKTNIIGRRCDRCEENKYNISAGCIGQSTH